MGRSPETADYMKPCATTRKLWILCEEPLAAAIAVEIGRPDDLTARAVATSWNPQFVGDAADPLHALHDVFCLLERRLQAVVERSGKSQETDGTNRSEIAAMAVVTTESRPWRQSRRLGGHQTQADRVDAVTLICRGRVALAFKDMAQMAVAVGAQHFDAGLTQRVIGAQDHRVGVGRIEE